LAYNQLRGSITVATSNLTHLPGKTVEGWVDFEQRIIDRAINEWQNERLWTVSLQILLVVTFDTTHCSDSNTV